MQLEGCPGAKTFTQPTPEFVHCPMCHSEVEIWTDEVEAKCDGCGAMVTRELLQGCIDHCPSAKECLGEALYNKLRTARLRDKG